MSVECFFLLLLFLFKTLKRSVVCVIGSHSCDISQFLKWLHIPAVTIAANSERFKSITGMKTKEANIRIDWPERMCLGTRGLTAGGQRTWVGSHLTFCTALSACWNWCDPLGEDTWQRRTPQSRAIIPTGAHRSTLNHNDTSLFYHFIYHLI